MYKQALKYNFVVSLVGLLLAGMLLDGGLTAKIFGVSVAMYWLSVISCWVLYRTRTDKSKIDIFLTRYGLVIATLLSYIYEMVSTYLGFDPGISMIRILA